MFNLYKKQVVFKSWYITEKYIVNKLCINTTFQITHDNTISEQMYIMLDIYFISFNTKNKFQMKKYLMFKYLHIIKRIKQVKVYNLLEYIPMPL